MIVYMRGENHASHKRTSSPARVVAEAVRRSRHRPQQADFESDWNVRGSWRWSRDNMRCTAFHDTRLKPLHERSELCGERLSV